jgi:eukaryotic-like serine/threonine-protein kinase
MAVTTGLALYAWHARGEALRAEANARLEAATARQVTDFLVDTFDVVRPRDRDGNRVLARELLDNAARELRGGLEDQPVVRARMLETVGRVYRQIGLLTEARPLLDEALTLRNSTGADALELGSSLHQVAALELASDHFEAAEKAARDALTTLGHSQDPRAQIMRAEVLLALGGGYVTRSRFAEADVAIAEALEIRTRVFGAQSAEAAATRLVAARSWREQGEFDRATQAVESALRDFAIVYRGEHVDIAQGQRELAIIYQERGDFENYERIARLALESAERLYGAESPNISSFVELMANAAYTNKRMSEAIAGMRRVLALRTGALGPNHTRTGYAHYNLGYMLGKTRRYGEAMPHLIEAQRIWELALGPQHPDVAYALDARAEFLRMQGKLREAEPFVRRALAINEAANGPDHPSTARSVLNLANWMRDCGRLDESRTLYDRAEKIRVKAFGAESAYVEEVRKARAVSPASATRS